MFKKILAVDDSDIILNLHQMSFRRFPDTKLVLAKNGVEALKRLGEEEGIELVLLDINMPLMDGITFLEIVRREQEKYGDVAVVIISTEGEEASVMEALRKGATAYIKKPFRQRELIELLEKVEAKVKAGA
jgi:two-component system, chemotaxis family, chemotaxis protein CheY